MLAAFFSLELQEYLRLTVLDRMNIRLLEMLSRLYTRLHAYGSLMVHCEVGDGL
jgi:hypothetical protein